MQAIKVHLSMAVQPPSVTILLDPILFKEVRTHKTRKKKNTNSAFYSHSGQMPSSKSGVQMTMDLLVPIHSYTFLGKKSSSQGSWVAQAHLPASRDEPPLGPQDELQPRQGYIMKHYLKRPIHSIKYICRYLWWCWN